MPSKVKRKCPACKAEFEEDEDGKKGEATATTKPVFPGVKGLEAFQAQAEAKAEEKPTK